MADRKGLESKTKSIPITSRSIFRSGAKVQFELDNPDMTKLEIFRILGDQWNRTDAATRAQFERKADYVRRAEGMQKSLHSLSSRGNGIRL
jgi:hypothetical protein